MPTTLTGLFLLVLLVLPGITYVARRERGIPERRRSVFRETTTVVVAGVVANTVAFWIIVVAGVAWPQLAPNISALLGDTSGYIKTHYVQVAAWSTAVLAVAVLVALGGAWLAGKTSPHPSTMSSWWVLFERWKEGRDLAVSCVLDDGSWIGGQLGSFNMDTDETQDRDLILKGPLQLRQSPTGTPQSYDAGAVCIPARRINALYVSYLPPGSNDPVTSPEEGEAAVAEEAVPPAESGARSSGADHE